MPLVSKGERALRSPFFQCYLLLLHDANGSPAQLPALLQRQGRFGFRGAVAGCEWGVQSVARIPMKRLAVPIMIVLALSSAGWSQTSSRPTTPNQPVKKSPLVGYAGTWVGIFEERPWLTVQLALQGQQLTGSLRRAYDLKFNDAGELKSVGDTQVTEVIEDAALNGDGLLLTAKNPDTNETDRFTMRLTSETTSELKMSAMSMPPGMPKLKPWKLTRVAAAPSPPAAR